MSSSILLAIANKFGIGFDNGSSEDEDSDFSDEEEECNNEESVSSEEGSSSGGNSSRKRQRESDIHNGLTSDGNGCILVLYSLMFHSSSE